MFQYPNIKLVSQETNYVHSMLEILYILTYLYIFYVSVYLRISIRSFVSLIAIKAQSVLFFVHYIRNTTLPKWFYVAQNIRIFKLFASG